MGLGAAIGAIGSSLISGGISYLGASHANAANLKMQKRQHRFEEQEADKARRFTRKQARQARGMERTEARKARKYGRQQAERERTFERHMSNTEVRRRVKDLRAAGLNPILAVRNGMAASSPSVSPPRAAQARGVGAASSPKGSGAVTQQINELQGLANSAGAAFQNAAEVRRVIAESKVLEETAKIRAHDAEAAKYYANSAKSKAAIDELNAQRVRDYGGSSTGQNLFSIERLIGRIGRFFGLGDEGQTESEEPLVVPIYPGGPGPLLPDERFGGVPFEP